MTAREFLSVLHEACKNDKRFDRIEAADKPSSNVLRVYPFDGPPLIIQVHKEGA